MKDFSSTHIAWIVRERAFKDAQQAFRTGNLEPLIASLEADRRERARKKADRARALRHP